MTAQASSGTVCAPLLIYTSRVVPHRSTTPARTCLTSLFGWEAVSQADMAALTAWLEMRY